MFNNSVGRNVHIPVRFRKFRLNKDLPGLNWSPDRTDSITSGYVYTFRYEHTSWPDGEGNVTSGPIGEIKVERFDMVCEDQPCFIYVTSRLNTIVHFAYSRIILSDDRIESIRSEIKKWRAIRAIFINTLPVTQDTQGSTTNREIPLQRFNSTRRDVYLHDWYGYLEECADDYQRIVSANIENYTEHLRQEINPAGAPQPPGGGVARGALFDLADTIETIITDRSGWIGDYRRVMNMPAFNGFFNRERDLIFERRGGAEWKLLNNTIRRISLLLGDRYANSTYLDYIFGTDGQIDDLLGLINKSLYRHDEILLKNEKRLLFRVWENIFPNTDAVRVNSLLTHLRNTTEVTVRSVHGRIGDASIFIFMASLSSIAEKEAALNLIENWLVVGINGRDRLRLNGILVEGGLKRFAGMETGLTNHGLILDRRVINDLNSFTFFEVRVSSNGREVLMKLVSLTSLPEQFAGFFLIHNIMTQIALIGQHRRFYKMLPHSLIISGEILTAIFNRKTEIIVEGKIVKKALLKYGAIKSMLSSYILFLSVRSFISGDVWTGAIAAVSGVTYISAAILAKTLLKAKFLPVFLIRVGAIALSMLVKQIRGSNVRLMLEHSIWGNRSNTAPNVSWWPILPIDNNVSSIAQEILISNSSTDGQTLMPLNIAQDILETYNRNAYMLRVVTESPPIVVTSNWRDRYLNEYSIANHRLIEIEGISNFLMIRRIEIKLNIDGAVDFLHDAGYNVLDNNGNVNNDVINLLVKPGKFGRISDRRLRERSKINRAGRIACVVHPHNLPQHIMNRLQGDHRYIRINAAFMHVRKRLEVKLYYIDTAELLPVRVEHFFT